MRIDWFVACQIAHPRPGQQGTGLWPASVAHAKRLGGSTTACGERAYTMKKLFEVPFPVVGENCTSCADAVVADRRARSRATARTPATRS